MLCSSEDNPSPSIGRDANVYHPFRTVDVAVADRIRDHLASATEDAHLRKTLLCRHEILAIQVDFLAIGLVGAITKALCRR